MIKFLPLIAGSAALAIIVLTPCGIAALAVDAGRWITRRVRG